MTIPYLASEFYCCLTINATTTTNTSSPLYKAQYQSQRLQLKVVLNLRQHRLRFGTYPINPNIFAVRVLRWASMLGIQLEFDTTGEGVTALPGIVSTARFALQLPAIVQG